MNLKIGSLFSGYGGLDMGVQAVVGGDVVWHVEFDAAPSKILAHHWPTVPNYGDITTVDWAQVEPVDVLTGGFPCQDLSLAGRRAGMRPGTRSGLWADFLKAIDALRPGLVVIENVRGLLSGCAESEADSDRGPCPRCADPSSGAKHAPNVRALGRVLIDLARIGYDAEWVGVRAADAGAPHNRYRVFVVAQDTQQLRREEGRLPASRKAPGRGARSLDHRPTGTPVPVLVGSDWGEYRGSIERWERILGRAAPEPTVPTGKGGRMRANPAFGEWMMGLPVGHITAPDIGWQQQWTILGNGVVPQQAELALRLLLQRQGTEIAA